MRKLTSLFVSFFLMLQVVCRVNAQEVLVTTPQGQSYILDVHSEDSFLDVAEQIQEFATSDENNISENFVFEVMVEGRRPSTLPYCGTKLLAYNDYDAKRGGPLSNPRDYFAVLSQREIDDIHFIVTFLANRSLAKIMTNKSALEAAGDRIEKVHPFNFLWCVFSDEEAKVAMHNVRNKKWVWKDFVSGLKESLTNEANRENLNQYIEDFAKRLNISPSVIESSILARRWDELIDTLINVIPRSGDHRRYGD